MLNTHKIFCGALFALLAAASLAVAQNTAVTKPQPAKPSTARATGNPAASHSSDLAPMTLVQPSAPAQVAAGQAPVPVSGSTSVVAAAPVATPATAASPAQANPLEVPSEIESGGVGVREFQGDDVGQV